MYAADTYHSILVDTFPFPAQISSQSDTFARLRLAISTPHSPRSCLSPEQYRSEQVYVAGHRI